MSWFKNFDWYLLLLILVIFGLGALILFSIDKQLFRSQLIFFSLSLPLFFLLTHFDYKILKKFGWLSYIISVVLLGLTFILGSLTRGVIRWISLASFNFQPAEIVKPFLIVAFASFCLQFNLKKIVNLIKLFILFLVPAILIFKQPALGNSMVFSVGFLTIIFFAGLPKKYLLIGLLLLVIGVPFGYRLLKPYQQERIISFLNPDFDPLGSGYNLMQAKIAIGSGGIFGIGLGQGSQSQLKFLPERQSDFIFACLAEELGFGVATILIIAYLALIIKILLIVQKSQNFFGFLVGMGSAGMLLFQVVVNIGMNLGLLPITGITLPLVSYGGSSLISSLALLGLVEAIAIRPKRQSAIEIK